MVTTIDIQLLRTPRAKELTDALRKYTAAHGRPPSGVHHIFRRDVQALQKAAGKRLRKGETAHLVFAGIPLVEYAEELPPEAEADLFR